MEETEKRYYSFGLFDDEVIEKISANIKYIAEDGHECMEQLMAKPGNYRNELIYCYNLGEDYAMTHPHAKSAVRFLTEDAMILPYDRMAEIYPFFDLVQELFIGLLVNDSYRILLHKENTEATKQEDEELTPDSLTMALQFRERRDFPFENPVMDRHKKHCIICFLAGIRNVFKDELKKGKRS